MVAHRTPLLNLSLWITLLAAGVLLAPAIHTGPILTLDNVAAPNQVTQLVGISMPAVVVQRVLLLLAILPGILGVLLLTDVSVLAAVGIALLWIANPFIAERLAIGQWQLMIATSGLPWMLIAAQLHRKQPWKAAAIGAVMVLMTLALYPRAVSFVELLLICLGITWVITATASRRWFRAIVLLATAVVGSIAIHVASQHVAFDRVDGATSATATLFQLGTGSFLARTLGALNYLGFWAEGAHRLPYNLGSIWLLYLPAIALLPIAIIGWQLLVRRDRFTGVATVLLYVLSLLLVLSSIPDVQSPTVLKLYDLLGFVGLRETGKFMGGMLVAQSVGVGIAMSESKRWRMIIASIVCCTTLIVVPVTIASVWRSITPVKMPAELLNGATSANTQHQKVILFPWHRYQSFTFTNGRVVDQIAPTLFNGTVFNELIEYGGVQLTSADPWQQDMAHVTADEAIDGTTLTNLLRNESITTVVVEKSNDYQKYVDWAEKSKLSVITDSPTTNVYQLNP